MKITDDYIAKWFPPNRRFLHFCAKYYGYSFYSDDVVEEANFIAIKNVMSLKRREVEFEGEKHMVGTVMSTFRFAILNAYKVLERAKRLDVRTESEVTYSNGDDEFNMYLQNAVSNDLPYDNTIEIIKEFMSEELNVVERDIIRMYYLEDMTRNEIAVELDIHPKTVRNTQGRALTKLKKYMYEVTHITNKKEVKPRNSRKTVSVVPKIVRSKPAVTNKAKSSSHSEAMSFLYP
tara:strand:+ start:372 stop:1073 length:702 start_codon:yes stop_codon:yes gene_type:complete